MEIRGYREVQRMLADLIGRLENPDPVFREVGEIVQESVLTNFERGGRPPWKKLEDSTIAQRTKQRKWPGQILVRKGMSGGLMGSISYRTKPDGVIIFSNKKYAPLHQFGAEKGEFGTVLCNVREHTRKRGNRTQTVRAHSRSVLLPWGKVTARPFLVIQTDDIQEIKEMLQNYTIPGE